MPNYQFRATFRFTFSFGARFHRRIDGRPPQFDTRCKRFQNRFLFSVVGRRSFVSVTRKYLSVSRYNHCTYTIGRGRGRTFAAFVDRHLQVAAVFGGPVGLDRIGRDPHSSQRFGRMRRLQITGTDLQTGCPGIPHFYGRIDSQPEGIDQIFGKEHPERRSSSFDQQGAKSPFFKFGNDQSSRDLCGGYHRRHLPQGTGVGAGGEDDLFLISPGEEIGLRREPARSGQRYLDRIG